MNRLIEPTSYVLLNLLNLEITCIIFLQYVGTHLPITSIVGPIDCCTSIPLLTPDIKSDFAQPSAQELNYDTKTLTNNSNLKQYFLFGFLKSL